MKKLNILLTILMMALVSVSCESYDEAPSDFETIIGFSTAETTITFNPPLPDEPLPQVKMGMGAIYVTEASSVDRTFTVEVVADQTTVAAENYSFDANIVIPADSNEGTFVLTAFNISLTEDAEPIVIKVVAPDGLVSGQKITFALKKRV